MRDIFLLVKGQRKGPFSVKQIWCDLAEGRVSANTQAWHEGLSHWVTAEEIVFRSGEVDTGDQKSACDIKPKISATPIVPRIILRPIPEQPFVQAEEVPTLRPSRVSVPPVPVATTVLTETPSPVPGPSSPPVPTSSNIKGLGVRPVTEKEMAIFSVALALAVVLLIVFLLIASHPGTSRAQTAASNSNANAAIAQAQTTPPDANTAATSSPQAQVTPPNTNAEAITAALKEDDQWGQWYFTQKAEIVKADLSSDTKLSEGGQLVAQHVVHMRNIDVSNCPSDFREAYQRHIDCWSQYADSLADHPHITEAGEAIVGNVILGLAGDDGSQMAGYTLDAINQNDSYNQLLHERLRAISTSFHEVQDVAGRYGVRPMNYSSPSTVQDQNASPRQ